MGDELPFSLEWQDKHGRWHKLSELNEEICRAQEALNYILSALEDYREGLRPSPPSGLYRIDDIIAETKRIAGMEDGQ